MHEDRVSARERLVGDSYVRSLSDFVIGSRAGPSIGESETNDDAWTMCGDVAVFNVESTSERNECHSGPGEHSFGLPDNLESSSVRAEMREREREILEYLCN